MCHDSSSLKLLFLLSFHQQLVNQRFVYNYSVSDGELSHQHFTDASTDVTWTVTANTGLHFIPFYDASLPVITSTTLSLVQPASSGVFILSSCDKKMNSLVGVQHLSGSLGSCDGC